MTKLIISVIGSDRPGIVSELSGVITNNGGNIEESRMTRLGSDFVIIMLISVSSGCKASLVLALNDIKNLSLNTKVTKSDAIITGEHCQITLNGADNEGILNVLSNYLSEKSMNIQDMDTHITYAPVTGTPLFNLKTITTVPGDLNISDIQSDLDQIANKLGVEITMYHLESNE